MLKIVLISIEIRTWPLYIHFLSRHKFLECSRLLELGSKLVRSKIVRSLLELDHSTFTS